MDGKDIADIPVVVIRAAMKTRKTTFTGSAKELMSLERSSEISI
jgi:hypothetical protein